MFMVAERTGNKGFLTAELAVSIALLGLILAGLATSLQGFARLNHYQWTRQRCVAAAEAQLDSLTVTGKPVDDAELKRLWPEVNVAVDRRAGVTPWDGLDLVRITATGRTGAREVTVRLERYVKMDY